MCVSERPLTLITPKADAAGTYDIIMSECVF